MHPFAKINHISKEYFTTYFGVPNFGERLFGGWWAAEVRGVQIMDFADI